MTAFHRSTLLSSGAAEIPAGGSFCILLSEVTTGESARQPSDQEASGWGRRETVETVQPRLIIDNNRQYVEFDG